MTHSRRQIPSPNFMTYNLKSLWNACFHYGAIICLGNTFLRGRCHLSVDSPLSPCLYITRTPQKYVFTICYHYVFGQYLCFAVGCLQRREASCLHPLTNSKAKTINPKDPPNHPNPQLLRPSAPKKQNS